MLWLHANFIIWLLIRPISLYTYANLELLFVFNSELVENRIIVRGLSIK